jgi:molecular chaperone Hsp33
VRLTQTYQQTLNQHHYPDILKELLSEALICTALIHGLFKNIGKITLQFQSSGPLSLLSIHGDLTYMRGLAQYSKTLETLKDPMEILRSGQLVLTYDFGEAARHQSIIEITSPSLVRNIEYYFAQSEQTPTHLWLASSPYSVSGLLLQKLPAPHSKQVSEIEAWDDAIIRTDTLFDEELRNLLPEELLPRLFPEDTIQLFSPEPIQFKCPCNKERMEKALILMGKEELMELLKKDDKVDVSCQFCGKHHAFDLIDVEKLFR